MAKGYAEGSALEEALADLERAQRKTNTPAMPTASSSVAFLFPRVEERLDVMALRLAELELRETAPRLRRVVVGDCRFEPLAQWCRLRELTP